MAQVNGVVLEVSLNPIKSSIPMAQLSEIRKNYVPGSIHFDDLMTAYAVFYEEESDRCPYGQTYRHNMKTGEEEKLVIQGPTEVYLVLFSNSNTISETVSKCTTAHRCMVASRRDE